MKSSSKKHNKHIANQIQSEAQEFSKRLTFFISGLHKYLRPNKSKENSEELESSEGNGEILQETTQVVSELHDIYHPLHTVKKSSVSVQSQPVRDTIGGITLSYYFHINNRLEICRRSKKFDFFEEKNQYNLAKKCGS